MHDSPFQYIRQYLRADPEAGNISVRSAFFIAVRIKPETFALSTDSLYLLLKSFYPKKQLLLSRLLSKQMLKFFTNFPKFPKISENKKTAVNTTVFHVFIYFSAQDKTRTCTAFRPLPPQSSVYTNFTTWANPLRFRLF